MPSQQSIQDEAFRIANTMASPDQSPIIDNFFVTEDLFRDALTQAVQEQRFRRSFDLTIVDGAATLPDVILTENNTISVEGDTPTSFESYIDFLAAPLDIINYVAMNGNQFLYREAGGSAASYDGDITITAVALPTIPATITDSIDIPQTLADRTSGILAQMMVGGK